MQHETDVQESAGSLAQLLKGYGRGFWFGLGVAAGLWLTVNAAIPARIRLGRVSTLSGTRPVSAEIGWSYGRGARPVSVIFDVHAAQGALGSVTVDGEALEAEIPLPQSPTGPYRLIATATYRLFSRPQTLVYSFEGTFPEG
jgi:hypothetical protein